MSACRKLAMPFLLKPAMLLVGTGRQFSDIRYGGGCDQTILLGRLN
jgi:hypothetical protein